MTTRSQGAIRYSWIALLVSAIPFLSGASLLMLRFGVGPRLPVYLAANISGFLMFGFLIIASAFTFIAWMRSEGRSGWRLPLALLLQVLSLLEFYLFVR